MKLLTLSQLEKSVGGRPKMAEPKERMSFYVSQMEAEQLKVIAENESRPVSQLVRLIMSEYLTAHPAQK